MNTLLGHDVRRRVRLGAYDELGLDLIARGVEVEPLQHTERILTAKKESVKESVKDEYVKDE